MIRYARGSVYWYKRNIGDSGVIYGTHPCVIISPNSWNAISESVIVIPCTSTFRSGALKDMQLQLEKDGYFLPCQITTIPKKWLFNYQGMLDESEMNKLLLGVVNMLSSEIDLNIINITSEVESNEDESEFNSEPEKAETKEVDYNSIYYKEPEKSETASNRSRKQYWSPEKMKKFIADCANNPVSRIQTIYNLSSPNTVYKYKHKFTQELKKC